MLYRQQLALGRYLRLPGPIHLLFIRSSFLFLFFIRFDRSEASADKTCSEGAGEFAGSSFDENKSKGAKVGGGDDESTIGVDLRVGVRGSRHMHTKSPPLHAPPHRCFTGLRVRTAEVTEFQPERDRFPLLKSEFKPLPIAKLAIHIRIDIRIVLSNTLPRTRRTRQQWRGIWHERSYRTEPPQNPPSRLCLCAGSGCGRCDIHLAFLSSSWVLNLVVEDSQNGEPHAPVQHAGDGYWTGGGVFGETISMVHMSVRSQFSNITPKTKNVNEKSGY
ncbi:hypothetical protein CPC08DRAFT_119850 [Agrocybe pediades]|nr:hypothetical protein CPC08DRAFT_119850 [Agrocybe pediades]